MSAAAAAGGAPRAPLHRCSGDGGGRLEAAFSLPRRQRHTRAAAGLRLLCCAAALHAGCRLLGADLLSAGFAEPAQQDRRPTPRRQPVLLLSSAVAGAGAALLEGSAAEAIQVDTRKTEIVRVPANGKAGTRSYLFEKPAGFKRFASPVDPSGFLFRNTNDTYFTFVTRAEKRDNASAEFTPQAFIDDYNQKFVNATGSSFKLIKGSTTPDRIDADLGVKYYEVEYVVRTQLGFTFDTLRSLHFLTTFAAAPDSIYIMNCQAPEEEWQKDGPVLRKVSDSFAVAS